MDEGTILPVAIRGSYGVEARHLKRDEVDFMVWQITPYTIPLLGASIVSALSALYMWRHHQVSAAKTLSLILLVGTGWLLCYVLEYGSTALEAKIIWSKLQYVTVVIISMGWFIFTLQYTAHERWVTRRTIALLGIVPLITMFLVLTNETHRLIWEDVELITGGSFVLSHYTHGPWFWVHSAYSYMLVLGGSLLLLRMLFRSQYLYRWQIGALLLAAFLPVLESILYITESSPLSYMGLTVFGFPAACLAVLLCIFRFRLGDIVPVAREAIIENMGDGVLVLDPLNRIVDVNPLTQELMGHSASEVLGQPIGTVWPNWSDCLMGADTDKEIVVNNPHGQRFYDVRVSPLKDVHGDLVSQIVVLRDITDRKRAEELLHESEEKFRTIFEHASDEIVYLDKYGNILDINKKGEEMFGYKRDQFIGKNFTEIDFIDPENMKKVRDLFSELLIGSKPVSLPLVELEVNHENGTKVFAEVSTELIKKNGEVEGVLSIIRDITERKRAEEKVKQSLEEKEVLLREIHHRVKNNLQVISSLLNLQSAYVEDCQYKEMFKESQNRVKSMSLIHEKLYQSENLANIDFEEYVRALTNGLIRSYGINTDKVSLEVEVGHVSLGIDTAIPCGLVINELVSNSLKHAFPGGKGEILVSLHTNNGTTELTVKDNGVGIPEDISLRRTESLGLRLVSILVEDQMKGNIDLIRTEGTEFRITFREGK
jgi:PAS domain S-box-containing protein